MASNTPGTLDLLGVLVLIRFPDDLKFKYKLFCFDTELSLQLLVLQNAFNMLCYTYRCVVSQNSVCCVLWMCGFTEFSVLCVTVTSVGHC